MSCTNREKYKFRMNWEKKKQHCQLSDTNTITYIKQGYENGCISVAQLCLTTRTIAGWRKRKNPANKTTTSANNWGKYSVKWIVYARVGGCVREWLYNSATVNWTVNFLFFPNIWIPIHTNVLFEQVGHRCLLLCRRCL